MTVGKRNPFSGAGIFIISEGQSSEHTSLSGIRRTQELQQLFKIEIGRMKFIEIKSQIKNERDI